MKHSLHSQASSGHITRLTAIAGGIGSGKSVVSRVVAALGYPVYDCDSRARRLIDESESLTNLIAERVCREALPPGATRLNRSILAECVFADSTSLEILNQLVHEAVRADITRWASEQRTHVAFVETAILYQSQLDRMVHSVWEVYAPAEIRIERVMLRNGLTREQVLNRINSQDSYIPERRHHSVSVICNDGKQPVLPVVESLLAAIS